MSKKILAVFDGTKYSDGASKYAIEIAKATNSLLVGVFVQDMRYLNFTYAYTWDQPFVDFTAIEDSQKEEREKIDLNIKLFNRACDEKGIHHKVHLDKGVPLRELLTESSFSDLIIIDAHTSFFTLGNTSPSPFLKDLLADSHCPVLIVPHQYSFFDKTVLCYDGSPSSLYAIKMFSYLFSEFSELETTVLSVNEKTSNHLSTGFNVKDLIHTHFKHTAYEVLNGNVETELINYLKNNAANAVVVMGSYGRNAISRAFHQSLSNKVIQEVNAPVFITHQ
ncbi:MAG TPA: universal stress protein [Chitinophagales bacterium]|nr:universal stress protein [Chitinophagales bacterium]